MLHEIRDLGFEYAELSHGVRIKPVAGHFFDAVDRGEIKISSLHKLLSTPHGRRPGGSERLQVFFGRPPRTR